jgi:hypothetical protein
LCKFFWLVKVERVWFDPTSEGIRPIRGIGQGDDFVTTIKQTLGDVFS